MGKAYAVPGTTAGITPVTAKVERADGSVNDKHFPRVALPGQDKQVFEIADTSTITEVSDGTAVGDLVEVAYVGGYNVDTQSWPDVPGPDEINNPV